MSTKFEMKKTIKMNIPYWMQYANEVYTKWFNCWFKNEPTWIWKTQTNNTFDAWFWAL